MARLVKTYWPLLLAQAAVAICFWPGHMNADTLFMIDQASGEEPINDHHAPLLVSLWSLVWPLGVYPGAVLLLQTAAFLAGAYLVARVAFRPLGASIVAAAVALSPPVFGYLGAVTRDVWFLSLLVLAFGLLLLATRREGAAARWALAGAVAAAFLCLAARQNAAPAVVVALVAVAAIVLGPRLAGRGRLARIGAPLAAGIAATVAMLGLQLGISRVTGVDSARPEQTLYMYDLANLSVRQGESLLPGSVFPEADVAVLDEYSSTDSVKPLTLNDDAPIPFPLTSAQVDDLREAWVDEATGDPLAYLDLRWDAWLRQLGITRRAVFIYHPAIDENDRGYQIEFARANVAAKDYVEAFTTTQYLDGSIIHAPFIYLIAAALAAALLLRQRSVQLRIAGALAASAWAYQVGLFFGTMVTQYRFEYPAVAVGLLTAIVAVKVLVDRARTRREAVASDLLGPGVDRARDLDLDEVARPGLRADLGDRVK